MPTDPAVIVACFVEEKCTVGGTDCPAWNDWFQACDDTDPGAFDEDCDPAPLLEWPFDPLGCERPDICPLYRDHLLKDQTHGQYAATPALALTAACLRALAAKEPLT